VTTWALMRRRSRSTSSCSAQFRSFQLGRCESMRNAPRLIALRVAERCSFRSPGASQTPTHNYARRASVDRVRDFGTLTMDCAWEACTRSRLNCFHQILSVGGRSCWGFRKRRQQKRSVSKKESCSITSKGERDGASVLVPKTVRLACYALLSGVRDYHGPENDGLRNE
jgi:hypothetical protein